MFDPSMLQYRILSLRMTRYNKRSLIATTVGAIFAAVSLSPFSWTAGTGSYRFDPDQTTTIDMTLYGAHRTLNGVGTVRYDWSEKCRFVKDARDDIKDMCWNISTTKYLLIAASILSILTVLGSILIIRLGGSIQRGPEAVTIFNTTAILFTSLAAAAVLMALVLWTGFGRLDRESQLFFFGNFINVYYHTLGFYLAGFGGLALSFSAMSLLCHPMEQLKVKQLLGTSYLEYKPAPSMELDLQTKGQIV